MTRVFYILSAFFSTTILGGGSYCYSHCTDEETGVPCLRSHSTSGTAVAPDITSSHPGQGMSPLFPCLFSTFFTVSISRLQKIWTSSTVDTCIPFTLIYELSPICHVASFLSRSLFQSKAIWRHHDSCVSLLHTFKIETWCPCKKCTSRVRAVWWNSTSWSHLCSGFPRSVLRVTMNKIEVRWVRKVWDRHAQGLPHHLMVLCSPLG